MFKFGLTSLLPQNEDNKSFFTVVAQTKTLKFQSQIARAFV